MPRHLLTALLALCFGHAAARLATRPPPLRRESANGRREGSDGHERSRLVTLREVSGLAVGLTATFTPALTDESDRRPALLLMGLMVGTQALDHRSSRKPRTFRDQLAAALIGAAALAVPHALAPDELERTLPLLTMAVLCWRAGATVAEAAGDDVRPAARRLLSLLAAAAGVLHVTCDLGPIRARSPLAAATALLGGSLVVECARSLWRRHGEGLLDTLDSCSAPPGTRGIGRLAGRVRRALVPKQALVDNHLDLAATVSQQATAAVQGAPPAVQAGIGATVAAATFSPIGGAVATGLVLETLGSQLRGAVQSRLPEAVREENVTDTVHAYGSHHLPGRPLRRAEALWANATALLARCGRTVLPFALAGCGLALQGGGLALRDAPGLVLLASPYRWGRWGPSAALGRHVRRAYHKLVYDVPRRYVQRWYNTTTTVLKVYAHFTSHYNMSRITRAVDRVMRLRRAVDRNGDGRLDALDLLDVNRDGVINGSDFVNASASVGRGSARGARWLGNRRARRLRKFVRRRVGARKAEPAVS